MTPVRLQPPDPFGRRGGAEVHPPAQLGERDAAVLLELGQDRPVGRVKSLGHPANLPADPRRQAPYAGRIPSAGRVRLDSLVAMQLGVNVPNFGPGTDPGVLRELGADAWKGSASTC